MFSFIQVLQRGDPSYGSLVKSLHLVPVIADQDVEEKRENLFVSQASSFSTLPTSASPSQRLLQGWKVAVEKLFNQLNSLQSLVMEQLVLGFPHLQHRVDGQLVPHTFLTNSLKKLSIPQWEEKSEEYKLSAKNVVWLLVFCRRIEMASLGFTFAVDDFEYCSEFSPHYDGLSSIKRLALCCKFVEKSSDRRTWWGLPSGADKKTQAIIHLLRSTNRLRALEVNIQSGVTETKSFLSHHFISSLSNSFDSLRHLRLLGHLMTSRPGPSSSFEKLKELNVLTVDSSSICELNLGHYPPKLEVLYLPYYMSPPSTQISSTDFEEEIGLAEFLDSKNLPHLKQVLVPARPISRDGSLGPDAAWVEKRSKLENANIFKSGKVELKKIDIGGYFGECTCGRVLLGSRLLRLNGS